ncbi:MAG: CAP domain-containing protein [Labilithrix sp.]|nr:CAP domain-containing protein [Labilithrix sp.]
MFRFSCSVAAVALVLPACLVASGELDVDEAASASTREARSKAVERDEALDAVCAEVAGPSRREQVCHRWHCEGRAARARARWSGDPARCVAGDVDEEAGARALVLVNLHRFLADVPPVAAEEAWTRAAQECALVAHANRALSHTPTPDWRCWSETAAIASSVGLLANRSAPPAIGAFFEDPGNETTMVHRRWLLSEALTRLSVGTTDRYSCVVVAGLGLDEEEEPGRAGSSAPPAGGAEDDGVDAAPRGWAAWPPPGPVPIDVFTAERLDEAGWTVQSEDDDLDRATASVTLSGRPLAVRVTHLAPLHGSRSAIRIVPDGWTTEAGRVYDVRVDGPREIAFAIEPIDCP